MIVQTMIVQTRVHYAEAETEALVLLRLGAEPAVSPTFGLSQMATLVQKINSS